MTTVPGLCSVEDVSKPPVTPLVAQNEFSTRVARNARSPICRLPQEVLADILRLAQEYGEPDGIRYETLMSYHHGDSMRRMEWIDPDWRHITLVCTYVRATALQCPELWCVMDISWPERWKNLCKQRAREYPLSMRSAVQIGDIAGALAIKHVVQQAQHVVLTLQGQYYWPAADIILVDSTLRSLHLLVEHVYARVPAIAPRMLPATITDLDMRVDYVKDIPKLACLKSLRIGNAMSGDQLRKWLRMTPNLTSLTLDYLHSQVENLIPPPRFLPCLADLSLFNFVGELLPYLSMLPLPTHSLHIVTECAVADELSVPQDLVDLYKYVSGFWTRASGPQDLPPAEVTISRLWGDDSLCKFAMSGTRGVQPGHNREVAISVDLHNAGIVKLGPFLDSVTHCNLIARRLADIHFTDLDEFPSLRSVTITTWEAQEQCDAVDVQTWANRRAQLGLQQVMFKIGQSGPPRGRRRRLWWLCVQWAITDGLLVNANWHVPPERFVQGVELTLEDLERACNDTG